MLPLKWVGGKQRLLNLIKSRLPSVFNDYHEPFLGGGSVYYGLFDTLGIEQGYVTPTCRTSTPTSSTSTSAPSTGPTSSTLSTPSPSTTTTPSATPSTTAPLDELTTPTAPRPSST